MISIISWDVQQARAVLLLWWGVSVTKHPPCVCSSWPGRISSRFRNSVHRGCSDVVELKREMAEWQEPVVLKHLEVILVCYEIKDINRKQTLLWAPWELHLQWRWRFYLLKVPWGSPWWALHCPVLGGQWEAERLFWDCIPGSPISRSRADPSLRAWNCQSKLQFSLKKVLQCCHWGVGRLSQEVQTF